MPTQAQHLALVADRGTGELTEVTLASLSAENQNLRDELSELVRKFKGQSRELAELRRDKEAEAEEDALWPLAVRLFNYWRRCCGHDGAIWTAPRFWLVHPFLRDQRLEDCLRAVAGARFDPFVTRRKNGTYDRHDAWELIFRDAGKLESFCDRAPATWHLPRGAADVAKIR